jgi:hypothetical protein
LRSFTNKSYRIDKSKLSFEFEEQYITIPLGLPLTGPLLEFYLYENNLSTFDYINNLNIIGLENTFGNVTTLNNLIGFKFKVNLDDFYL